MFLGASADAVLYELSAGQGLFDASIWFIASGRLLFVSMDCLRQGLDPVIETGIGTLGPTDEGFWLSVGLPACVTFEYVCVFEDACI